MCTGIKIISKTNDIFYGRTMDFTFDFFGNEDPIAPKIPTLIAQFPKGTVLNSQLNPWTAKYSFMGLAMSGTDQALLSQMVSTKPAYLVIFNI